MKRVILHNYNSVTQENDIALIETATSMELGTANAALIHLPVQGHDPMPNSYVKVAGWGVETNENEDIPEHLQIIRVPVVGREICQTGHIDDITKTMFCVGNFKYGGKSACYGDSGSGVSSANKNELWGIVSWGEVCAEPEEPEVNTRVGLYVNWIKKITGV